MGFTTAYTAPSALLANHLCRTRCITAFVKEDELYRMMKDSYPPYAEMDALHFLMHDIQVPCLATLSLSYIFNVNSLYIAYGEICRSKVLLRAGTLQDGSHY